MGSKFERLLEPIKIGEVEIKNRIAIAPMGIAGLLNSNLAPGPRLLDYYLERARGGVGLIITGLFKRVYQYGLQLRVSFVTKSP